jgi:hypothetical protein
VSGNDGESLFSRGIIDDGANGFADGDKIFFNFFCGF